MVTEESLAVTVGLEELVNDNFTELPD